MKKNILLLTAASVLGLTAMSQVKPSSNKGGLILKGGVNNANITINESGSVDDSKSLMLCYRRKPTCVFNVMS